jgi:hypothetical protein
MYEDIVHSRQLALNIQKWHEGDRLHRIGQPFIWVDDDATPGKRDSELAAFMPLFTMIYEEYATPESIKCADFDDVLGAVREDAIRIFNAYFPYLPMKDYQKYIDAMALTRTQDYAFVRTFSDLKTSGVKHLDIGPGLGSHYFYSRHAFNSLYCGLEAHPESYQVQRNVYRLFSSASTPYYDCVAAEMFGIPDAQIEETINTQAAGVVHVPSWKAPLIHDNSYDLITATWVLNELTVAGILWLLGHSMRVLRVGGYFYIRDSDKLKPGRHQVSYNDLLVKLGFKEVKKLNVKNRVDMYGVPRMYQKTDKVQALNFEDMTRLVLGHFDTASNLLDKPAYDKL